MATQVSLAIAKVLQDGKWHPTAYFVAKAGYLIRPESAYRCYDLHIKVKKLVTKNVLNGEGPNRVHVFIQTGVNEDMFKDVTWIPRLLNG
jgi:hypothetical protein